MIRSFLVIEVTHPGNEWMVTLASGFIDRLLLGLERALRRSVVSELDLILAVFSRLDEYVGHGHLLDEAAVIVRPTGSCGNQVVSAKATGSNPPCSTTMA